MRLRNPILRCYLSSLHPFIHAAHCAITILPAVGRPYKTGRLKCLSSKGRKKYLSSSIHFEYRLSPYMELHARCENCWPYILVKYSLSFVKERPQGCSASWHADAVNQIQFGAFPLAQVPSQPHKWTVHGINLK